MTETGKASAHALLSRNVVVTGASRGFGRALARRFAKEGANLLLVSRPSAELNSLAVELAASRADGQTIEPCGVDIASSDAPDRIFAGLWRNTDALINNAAIQGPIGPLWQADWDAWRRTLEVDLLAPVALCRAVAPLMIARGGGCIVNLSGGGATGPRPNFSAYATAKAALVRFSECLAQEVREHGISVVAVAPGAMPTDMLRQVLESLDSGEREIEIARKTLAGGDDAIGAAASLCVLLASRPSRAMSGKLIAALWDQWQTLEDRADELAESDIYTLRRILPADRGKNWDKAR